jgi:hypothetical protein
LPGAGSAFVGCVVAGLWPYVGTAYVNKNASLNLYLNPGVSLMGGQKLHLRPARPQGAQVSRPPRPA